ncbi:UbiE Methylase involved in ubiquinone/menaquinone biosynthesis [Methylophilaceae bacterium]
MDTKHTHWENVYQNKASDAVSWYCEHLAKSLELIKQSVSSNAASIIDVGGGHATLVDDLLDEGFNNVSVLDISATAIDTTKKRLGDRASQVTWLVGDITNIALPAHQYDVWHDRAVFHFLIEHGQREAYVKQVARSVKLGGYVIVATFAKDGPEKCSGLDVVRYDANTLHAEFGTSFELIGSAKELHRTPFNTTQQFLYCYFRVAS